MPRHQEAVNVRCVPSTHWVRAAPVPPTQRVSYRPAEETVAVTVTMTIPGWDCRLIRLLTHAFRSWGGQRPMWFSQAPQLGTSQGVTATTSVCRPSNGTRAVRASKAAGHWCRGQGSTTSRGGRLPHTAKAPPPRGAMPVGAEAGQKLLLRYHLAYA